MADELRPGRVAELTIALSLATDLGTGQPMEHGLRTCRLALAASQSMALDDVTRSCIYYVALLRFIGCTSDASDTASLAGGDDIEFNAVMAPMLNAQPGESTRYFIRHLAQDLALHRRVGRVVRAMSDPGAGARSLTAHCEVARLLAARLGMADAVAHALGHAYERWDGKGFPAGLAGEEVPVAIRVVTVARDAELWTRRAGWVGAVDVLSHRRGHAYDPAVVDVVKDQGERWLSEVDDLYGDILEAEPAPVQTIATDDVDTALRAVADFADLKSPFLRGHSPGVAELAVAAAGAAGLDQPAATKLGRAALVHDVGRVGVPNGIWDRPGSLSAEQWERVRLHPYLTERVLHRCSTLSPFADVAARHHERTDGSGYHRGVSGDHAALDARILAAADAYHAMTEVRPHRPALTPAAAAAQLLDEVAAGRFGAPEVDAVLTAAGQERPAAQVSRPSGLTEREVDVLRLLARGLANREVATRLGISPKTVGHHVEHIYRKASVSTRAGATVFAMEHRLLS